MELILWCSIVKPVTWRCLRACTALNAQISISVTRVIGKMDTNIPWNAFQRHRMPPGQNVESNPIRKEVQAASIVSPVLSQTGEPFIEQLSTSGTTVRQQVKITIDRQNRMQITGLLPGQELYKYKDGSLKIHWNYQVLKRAHEFHYLNNFNCLQLSSLAGYLNSQAELQQDAATKQDLERRIKAISIEINRRYSNANENKQNK